MNWFVQLFTEHSVAQTVLVYGLLISIGIILGKVKIFGTSLGVTWILFIGLIASYFKIDVNIESVHFLRDFGLILFVYSIGLQVGPGFFSSLKSTALITNLLAASIVILGILITVGFIYTTGTPFNEMVGVMSGPVTNTPGLGAAQAAINDLKIPGIDETSRANGSRLGGVQAFWTGEAQTVTATKPAFRMIELELNKLMALCYATDEILTDAATLDAWIRIAFDEEMSFKLDDAVFSGTGAGMPLGIMNSGALVTVAKESAQAADTILHANITKMWNRLWGRNRASAAWFINQDVEPQLQDMLHSAGIMSPYAREYVERGTILGRPVVPVEQASTLGTAGDIVLADMSQYYMIEKGAGVDAAVSMHVRFLYDEQVFRFIYRADGQPSWISPLTPYKGTNTYSPFITLQAR